MADSKGKLAVIGMSGRFSSALSIAALWEALVDGRELIERFEEMSVDECQSTLNQVHSAHFVRARPLLGNVAGFDASFFGMTPRDADVMDPQLRLLLECSWEALEESGYASGYLGTIGVYAGLRASRYLDEHLLPNFSIINAVGRDHLLMTNRKDSAATMVAYRLDLTGPAVSVNTACSTSLVAIHLAASALLNFECDIALAGGAAIPSFEREGYLAAPGSPWSPDGHCRAFDADAAGTLDGGGGAMIALKRLDEALTDRDVIHAVILGSAINNDGAQRLGYSAPSVDGQERVIAEAIETAGISANSIGYVETHGTATPLGDPIEIAGLTRAFRRTTSRIGDCAIGSLKTNIGHLGAASGVAGLIKGVLSLEREMIPASLHFEKPNPVIDWATSPFFVNDRLRRWPRGDAPRRVGVSSFGIGGTNAHVVLEEPPMPEPQSSHRRYQLLMASAKTPSAVADALGNLANHIDGMSSLAATSFTLRTARTSFPFRRAVVADDSASAAAKLRDAANVTTAAKEAVSLAFVFAGQGSQRIGMGRALYEHEPAFRSAMDLCARYLRRFHKLDLFELIWPTSSQGPSNGSATCLNQTEFAQPALFALQWSLCELWASFGISPDVMAGHSLGEYVAACRAGVFELEDALSIIVARGRAMQRAPAGKMLAVATQESAIGFLLGDDLELAAVNGPRACVLSGTASAVGRAEDWCKSMGIPSKALNTSHAFHSRLMEPILPEFGRVFEGIRFGACQVPFISGVTGNWISSGDAANPEYWISQLRRPVRFFEGLRCLSQRASISLEVGPDATLTSFVKAVPDFVGSVATLNPQGSPADDAAMLDALGRLWELGVNVDWASFGREERLSKISLPCYPFQRRRHWIERAESGKHVQPSEGTTTTVVAIGDEARHFASLLPDVAVLEGADPSAVIGYSTAAILIDAELASTIRYETGSGAAISNVPVVLLSSSEPASRPPGALIVNPPMPVSPTTLFAFVRTSAALGFRTIFLVQNGLIVPSDKVSGAVRPQVDRRAASEDLRSKIVTIWKDALGIAQIGYEDNFFDLGGDSLLALQIIGRINSEFGCSIKPADLVAAATVAALADHVEQDVISNVKPDDLEALLSELRELPEEDAKAILR